MLQPKSLGRKTIHQSIERIEAVLQSHFFIRLAIGSWTEKEFLWNFLLNSTELTGDPIAWEFVVDGSKWDESTITIRNNEEIKTIDRMGVFNNLSQGFSSNAHRVALWHQHDDLFHLRVGKLFFTYAYFVKFLSSTKDAKNVTISYLIRKSDAFKREPHSRIEWRIEAKGQSTVEVAVETRGEDTDSLHSSVLVNLLESVASSIDLTDLRSEQKRTKQIEIQKLKDLQKLENEQNRIRTLEQKAQRCIDNDLCANCEEPVVQRRNSATSVLFYGCSQFTTHKCNATREITCPKCRKVMIEKPKRVGGSFLGCIDWPSCTGGRNIDETLEINTWRNSRNNSSDYYEYDNTPTLDELAQEWGFNNWNDFDDHRE